MLYHSETGQVEVLQVFGRQIFSPNGQWLFSPAHFSVKAVDSASQPVISTTPMLPGPGQTVLDAWSPDSQKISVLSYRRVTIYGIPDGNILVNGWAGDDIEPVPVIFWSPDSRWAVFIGNQQPGPGDWVSLFVVEVPEK